LYNGFAAAADGTGADGTGADGTELIRGGSIVVVIASSFGWFLQLECRITPEFDISGVKNHDSFAIVQE
jgi:hypothetical protein